MTSCSCSLLPMKAFIYIFDCAGSSVAACRDLIPWQGIEPRSPALGAWSLNHRTTKEVPYKSCFLQLLGTFLSVNLHATWFMNHWIKPVRSLRFAQLNSILWSKLSCDLNYLEMFVNLSKVTRPGGLPPGPVLLPIKATVLPGRMCSSLEIRELMFPVFERLVIKVGRQTCKDKSVLLEYFVSGYFFRGCFLMLYTEC